MRDGVTVERANGRLPYIFWVPAIIGNKLQTLVITSKFDVA
jgi:hypothetical protein